MFATRLFRSLALRRASTSVATVPGDVKVFDRDAKRRQRDWAVRSGHYSVCDYVKEEVGYRVADKIFDLTQFNPLALDLGCGGGHIGAHAIKENVGAIIQADMSSEMVRTSRLPQDDGVVCARVVCDEELVPFRHNSFDLVLTSMAAHWINDLPAWFRRIFEILREDGVFIGSMLSGDTIYELRCSLQLAEMERLGGVGAHVSPFVQPQDVGSLLGRAGFGMITLDTDEIEVGYPNMFALLYDLQGMAESNCAKRRSCSLRRDVLVAADAIYREMYVKEGKYPASFQLVSFIGWKPGPKMPKPAKRGSQNVSFKDLSTIIENPPQN